MKLPRLPRAARRDRSHGRMGRTRTRCSLDYAKCHTHETNLIVVPHDVLPIHGHESGSIVKHLQQSTIDNMAKQETGMSAGLTMSCSKVVFLSRLDFAGSLSLASDKSNRLARVYHVASRKQILCRRLMHRTRSKISMSTSKCTSQSSLRHKVITCL